MRKLTLAALLVAGWLVSHSHVFAADEEPDGPAGDLPEDEAAEDFGDEGEGGDTVAPKGKAPKGKAGGKGKALPKAKDKGTRAATGKGKVKPDASSAGSGSETATEDAEEGAEGVAKGDDGWESFASLGKGSSVATEITKGVRVEDIVEPPSDYRYAAFGKPDPFVPPLLTEEEPPGPSALEIPLVSPLQRFGLEELTIVGVWQLASGDRKAMVLTPAVRGGAGAGIIVKNGDLIGNRGGKILAIADDFMTVREFYLGADGTRQFEDRQLYMGRRAEEDLAGKIRFTPGQKQSQIIMEKDQTVVTSEIAGGAFDDGPLAGAKGKKNEAQEGAQKALKEAAQQGGERVPPQGGGGAPPFGAGAAGGVAPAAADAGNKAQFAPQGLGKPQFAPGGVNAEPAKAGAAAAPAGPQKF